MSKAKELLEKLGQTPELAFVGESTELDESVLSTVSNIANALRKICGNPVIDSVDTNAAAVASKTCLVAVDSSSYTVYKGNMSDIFDNEKYYGTNRASKAPGKVLFVDKILSDIKGGILAFKALAVGRLGELSAGNISGHLLNAIKS